MQGPYVYSLYREQYGFDERIVAILFVTGFVSAGLTAPLVGVWADQQCVHIPTCPLSMLTTPCSGRKRLCLIFCVTYALTCACIQIPILPVLFLGRVLGGISTSILYSAFESWVVSSANALALPSSDLSTILGRATLMNGFVATAAGIASNKLVEKTGSFASPFMASGVLLALAYVVIRGKWGENYGGGGGASAGSGDPFQLKRLGKAWRIVQAGTFASA